MGRGEDRQRAAARSSDPPPRRRGRPRLDEGPAVTRDAIVGTALVHLRENGAAGLSLREVSRHLGVSLAALQRHFATKDQLWRACVDAAVLDTLREDEEWEERDGRTVLERHLRAQIARAAVAPGVTAAIFNDTSDGSSERLAYLEERVRPVIDRARRRIEQGTDQGRLRAVDPSVVVALIGLGVGSVASSREALKRLFGIDLADPGDAERFAAALCDLIIHGILAR